MNDITPSQNKLSHQLNSTFFNETLQTIDFTTEQLNHNMLGHSFKTYKDSSKERTHRLYYSKIMEKKNSQNLKSREKIESKMPIFKT